MIFDTPRLFFGDYFNKLLIVCCLRFFWFLACRGLRPNYAPKDFLFCGNCLKVRVLWVGVWGMGGTTLGHFHPHKTLIVNTVSVSFSGNRAPITPH